MVSAHPRSRGEHLTENQGHRRAVGSSPLARGTHQTPQMYHQRGRLIPARAGNTFVLVGTEPLLQAHPRSRGEHEQLNRILQANNGSSPLARGTLLISGILF